VRYVPRATAWPSVASAATALPAPGAAAAQRSARPAVAPAPGSAGPRAYAAGTPVWGQALAPGTGAYQGPSTLSVRVLGHGAAVQAGITGVLFTAAAASGGAGPVRVGMDYSSFAQAYGGDYGSRLRLVRLPACALTTPQVAACRAQSPLGSVNDPAAQSVSVQMAFGSVAGSRSNNASAQTVSGAATVLGLTSTPSGGDGGGSGGTFGATTLKPAGSWSAGGSSGSFTYSYPISVPPAASTLVPTVALSYDSGSVDGQTAATQSQADWVGDGWSTPENYIEQTFVSCSDSPEGAAAAQASGDSCYDGPILTLSLNGSTTSLLCASNCSSGNPVWKSSTDNGEAVAHVTGSNNGSGTYNTDYWTVTDHTGTVFSFGMNHLPGWSSGQPSTSSVQYEPVYSAHQFNGGTFTDPCYKSTWSLSVCTMAYRWNLDYVKDLHGDAMAYYYAQDTNAYAQNGNTATATGYVRDSHLDHIDYGFTDGGAYGTVPDKVVFNAGERCVSGTCDPIGSNTANWPDVPYDLNCAAGGACQVSGPSFWSTVRLTGITTEQYNGSGYTPVDGYTFTQIVPSQPTGDTTNPTLWLSSITRTGSDTSAGGSAVPLNPVSFTPIQLTNRADITGGLPPLSRNRISKITTETGSVIGVGYELVNPCTAPITLAPASNTSSCFPVYWTPTGFQAPMLDWFNKYAVQQVTQSDPTGGSANVYTGYSYPGGAAWHYDDNEVTQAKYRTYGQFRGYGDVQTFTGEGNDAATEAETTYYRGMSNDNNTTAVTLTDSQGGKHDDTNQLAGQALETTGYNYANGPITGSTINSYWVSPATASRTRTGLPALTANATGQIETWSRQALTDTGTTTWRTTETDTTYDTNVADATFGLPTITYQHGDLSLTGNNQQRCTVTSYAPANTALNLTGLPAQVESDADPCGGANPGGASAPNGAQTNTLTAPASVNRPADVVSDKRTFYDLQPVGSTTAPTATPAWPQSPPTYGDMSETQVANGYTGGAFTYQDIAATTYDGYGRPLDAWDAKGNETQTAYTMANALTTGSTTTNALGQSTSTVLDPYRGAPISTTDPNGIQTLIHYDGLGRTIAVWDAGRPATAKANAAYTYTMSDTAPTVVTAQVLNAEGGIKTSTTLYDALLRLRQTQNPTPKGGRLVNDTIYDSRGWVYKKNTGYWEQSAAPNATLVPVADNAQGNFNQDVIAYDGAGRPVQDTSYNQGAPVATSYSAYYGDKTVTIPPVGANGKITGTPAATVTDALGRTTELDQYTTAPTVTSSTTNNITTVTLAGGATQATDYVFDNTGHQSDIKDASTRADWNTTYNLLGQAIAKNDPDAGATTGLTYDANGNLLQSTNARGKTVSYTYDPLNRKTAQYDAPTASQSSANQLDSWTYDNANNVTYNGVPLTDPIGQLTTATAYVAGNPYTTQADGFNAWGESTGETITLPASEGALAGPYTFTHSYDTTTTGRPYRDGYPASPNGGALPAESVVHGYGTALDLPVSLTGSNSYFVNTAYDAYGQLTMAELGSYAANANVFNTFDSHTGRLTDTKLLNNTVSTTVPIDETGYTYDAVGNPTSQTETRSGTTSETQCYQYDQLDRLTQAWTGTDQCAATPISSSHATVGDAIANGAYWSAWQYNSDGTRKSETDYSLTAGTANTVTSYTYGGTATGCTSPGGTHTLQTASTTGPSGTIGNTYCYDQSGNTTQRNTSATGQQSLTWNDQGQLQAVTTASAGSSYIYGPDGALLLQKDPGTTTLYLPGEQLALNTSTNVVTGTRFYPLPGGAQAVRTGTGTSYSFQISDLHNTSTLTLNNTLTNPVWRQQTPYGAPRGTAPTNWPDNHGFLNKPQDTTTGLTDIGARWYDPTTATFASLDPVLEPSSPQQLNGYSYAADNPITGADPTGLMACGDSGQCHGNPNQGGEGAGGNTCDATCQATQKAAAQLASDEAQKKKLEFAIAQLQAYLDEEKRILALEAADSTGGIHSTDGCTPMKYKFGACASEVEQTANACKEMGWTCLLAIATSALPIGEVANALGITDAAVAAGSKLIDAVPGLTDALTSTLEGAQKLLGAVKSQLGELSSKILGNEAALAQGLSVEDANAALAANKRLQHAWRHLQQSGLVGNWSGKTSPDELRGILNPVLVNPLSVVTPTIVKGDSVLIYVGQYDGGYVAAQVYSSGPLVGQLATAYVPEVSQLQGWGIVP
jgi:RHS repeat-associated protein